MSNSQCALAHNSKITARLCRLPKQELKIPNSDGVRCPPCKYRTKSKKLLQNKN